MAGMGGDSAIVTQLSNENSTHQTGATKSHGGKA